MKKIGWLARLFMSWESLELYFKNNQTNEPVDNTELKNVYDILISDKDKQIKSKDEHIADLNNQISENKQNLSELRIKYQNKNNLLENNQSSLAEEVNKANSLRIKLEEAQNARRTIENEIRDQLKTIGKIEKTFFAQAGNKGKGELGEQQVKRILQKTGISDDMWVENLTVGTTTVEFAMLSGEEGKYIPIDSKVLDAPTDENGLIEINDAYKNRVKTEATKIAKYLGKKNTADYGIMVLQSDSIYMKLFEEYPTFFQEMIEEKKIYINSPSSFVQTAWSIAHIIELYQRVKTDAGIYDEMISALDTVSKFANSLSDVHKKFNIAMNSHYPALSNKHNKLIKRLQKEDKIKEIKPIEFELGGE